MGLAGNSHSFITKKNCDLSNPLWRKSCFSNQQMKRRPRLDRRIKLRNPVERKVRTLKKLIPNCESDVGVEKLFRETADYIVALQVRVKVMQIIVDALSSGSDNE